MRIIFSPSKEMRDRETISVFSSTPVFTDDTNFLIKKLQSFGEDEIGKIMKIKGNLLKETYDNFQNYDSLKKIQAVVLYNGVSFKKLQLENYKEENIQYLRDNLIILSALYGALHSFDEIKPYRLDMTMKVNDSSLYFFWNTKITEYLNSLIDNDQEKILINLASGEYSKIIERKKFKHRIIDIDFKEEKNGKFVSVSSFSKQGRGAMLNYLVTEKISSLEKIKEFNEMGYSFNSDLSKENSFIFTRNSDS